jgi:arylsulfatase A-like enzyme
LAVLYHVEPPQPENQSPPNLVMIMLDPMRPDRIFTDGKVKDALPALSGIAVNGVAFTNAMASSSEPDWSAASALTSLWLEVPFYIAEKSGKTQKSGTPGFFYLQETLKSHGYQTAAFTAFTGAENAFRYLPLKGFDYGQTGVDIFSPAAPQKISAWLDQRDKDKPCFIFLHGSFEAKLKTAFAQAGVNTEQPSSADTDRATTIYDAALVDADKTLGAILKTLADAGLSGERTVIIVSSTRGIELGEHGAFFGRQLYRETASVPVFMSWSGHLPTGKKVDAQVRLMDISPTFFDYAGLTPPVQSQGVSLRPFAGSGFKPDLSSLTEQAPDFDSSPFSFNQAFRMAGMLYYKQNTEVLFFNMTNDPQTKLDLLEPANFATLFPGVSDQERISRFNDIFRPLVSTEHNWNYFNIRHLQKLSSPSK